MLGTRIQTTILIVFLAAAPSTVFGDSITPVDLAARLGSDNAPLVLDVRTGWEYESGHVPGAINIPYDELSQRLTELNVDRDQEVVVYCEVGGRAAVANDVLQAAGFTHVMDLEGHMQKWRAENYPQE
jgi:phage shock protein E